MWVMRIVLPYQTGYLVADRMKAHGVSCFGYPVSHFIEKGVLNVITVGTFVGSPKAVTACVKDLRRDRRMVRLDICGNFAIMHMTQPREIEVIYNPLIIHLSPSVVTAKGDCIFELGSWNQHILKGVTSILTQKEYRGKLLWMKQKKIKNVQVISAAPNLTEKQRHALDLAIENGYYDYPRKITLEKLAHLAKISYSTFQFHLQNAEKKVMPSLKPIYR